MIRHQSNQTTQSCRRGFTLVEMLVATALVVLMMVMFAQVFTVSSGLVSRQKGMAELDQSARTLTILLRGDIKQRTFVDVVPFVGNQNTDNSTVPGYDEAKEKGYDGSFRRGFFSISENDASDPTDDVLHLIISTASPLSQGVDGKLSLPFSGRTRLLRNTMNPTDDDQYLIANSDQPEFDDGQETVNNTGSSRYAEVCWFVRNGKLYRRILLIRDHYDRGNNPPSDNSEPYNAAGTEFFNDIYDPNNDGNADIFWRDFDYSAYWEPTAGLKFHAVDSLDNVSTPPGNANLLGIPVSLGVPFLRYGSSVSRASTGAGLVINGPREFIPNETDTNRRFIGRFTILESADSDFAYPGGDYDPSTDPHNSAAGGPTLALNNDGFITNYANETNRRGEDLVLSNVHEFDIQVWDDAIGSFVNLGHSQTNAAGTPGWFHSARQLNANFGNRFDTWHPHSLMPQYPTYAPFDPNPNDGIIPAVGSEQGARSAEPSNGLGSDSEIWLRAIRIHIRYLDDGSGQMRDMTFTFRLNRENTSN